MRSDSTTRPRWLTHTLALVGYSLLALIVTYPMPLHLGTRIIANQPGQVDGFLGIWNVWWTAHALTTGQSPFVTPLLFHPQGLDLFWQTLSLPQGLLALPVTLGAGPLPAYNLLILLSFILGGYFSFLFISYALCNEADPRATTLAAFIGGAVYAFAPFHMQKVLDGQLEVASVQWLPLWALASLALLEQRRWPMALLSGAALLWVGLGTWYYGLFALIASGLMALLWALPGSEPPAPRNTADATRPSGTTTGVVRVTRWPTHARRGRNRLGYEEQNRPTPASQASARAFSRRVARGRARSNWPTISDWLSAISLSTLLWGLTPIAIWFLVMAPRLLSLMRIGDTLLGDARGEQQAYADLIAFWLPSPNHPLWGPAVTSFYERLHPGEILWNVAIGLVGTVLALYGVALTWRRHWRWLALGLFAGAMALGAEIFIFGWNTGVPGPYALIRDLPGVRSSHRPNHFVLISILTTALFAAAGARALLVRTGRAAPALAAALVAALIAIDGWAGALPLYQRAMPAPYLHMPAPDGALLPVPPHINFSNSENLWYQTRHHWPIIGGFIGREPPYPLARYAPGIKELRFGQVERDDILSPGWPALARETLAAYQIRYVMFHHRSMGSPLPRMREIIAEMGLSASYRDDLITIHPVPVPATPRPLAYLGPGWGNLERGEDGTRWRWMGDTAELYLLNPTGAPRPVRLTLDLEAYTHPRILSARLGDGPPFSLAVSRARMQRSLQLILPPGETVLYLDAPADSPPGQPTRRLSLAVLGISIE